MKKLIPLLLLAACRPSKQMEVYPDLKGDTIHEVMLISTRLPGFVFVKYGQAIQRNGICIAHLDCRGQLLKPPIYVWTCETERKRREGR